MILWELQTQKPEVSYKGLGWATEALETALNAKTSFAREGHKSAVSAKAPKANGTGKESFV